VRMVTSWTVSNGPGLLRVQDSLAFEDRVPLRAELGQSQSGNSSLSPQTCRVEPFDPAVDGPRGAIQGFLPNAPKRINPGLKVE